ncbi:MULTISPECIES: hypothetical protein [unclassified Bacillus (in: firmicutes)]|uniref:hypothetical protein n=1 Tax=unclassified Bacillus (in: firmicutes) TaxID=185979 RepID=UPI001BEBB8FF|nr:MULTISPECIES: hypothetical protein [unclassified Bacillus (in: firmicutes)]MBT2618619.1 hypothetical protein [Bacillus sp. ISL-78]MBT2628915.1 hypothetical protein [Bacillus sp. ISL-101]MBT2715005.1 hypothetical protein [Bacillus sp. ISL-57]
MGNLGNQNPLNSHWGTVCFNDSDCFGKKSRIEQESPCKTCGSCDSACKCDFKAAARELASPLNSDCVLVNSVVGSKAVQKAAEATFPFTAFTPAIPAGSTIVSVSVLPNLAGVTRNTTIIRDKVVNIGLIPVTITVTFLAPGSTTPATATLTTSLPFQEHTDFPGACPEDTVVEPPLVVEGIFAQAGTPFVSGTGVITTDAILVKVVLRTTITVIRPVIVDSHGGICDVNERRCETTNTPTTNFFNTAP